MNQENKPYSERDHRHCFEDINRTDHKDHLRCCLCNTENTMQENKPCTHENKIHSGYLYGCPDCKAGDEKVRRDMKENKPCCPACRNSLADNFCCAPTCKCHQPHSLDAVVEEFKTQFGAYQTTSNQPYPMLVDWLRTALQTYGEAVRKEGREEGKMGVILEVCDAYDKAIKSIYGDEAVEIIRKEKSRTLTNELAELSEKIQALLTPNNT